MMTLKAADLTATQALQNERFTATLYIGKPCFLKTRVRISNSQRQRMLDDLASIARSKQADRIADKTDAALSK